MSAKKLLWRFGKTHRKTPVIRSIETKNNLIGFFWLGLQRIQASLKNIALFELLLWRNNDSYIFPSFFSTHFSNAVVDVEEYILHIIDKNVQISKHETFG